MMTRTARTDYSKRAIAFIASRRFFILLLFFFVLEALWIALSGRYPMAFDEDFHLGLIKLYSHHPSPFWSAQPENIDVFGAVIRDPSYLYHWLMSFPYRLIAAATHNQTAQALCLRFINIALFTSALPLFRRLLLKTGASTALVQGCLALFVLIPIAPLLAAQINYDNLFLPLTALTILVAITISDELKRTKRLKVRSLLSVFILIILTSLVKYAFLPGALVIVVFLAVHCYQTYPTWRKFRQSLGFGFTLMPLRTRWLLIGCCFLVAGLFVQRYGVNLIRYHKPVPNCSQVLSVERCKSYAPWVRDYILETARNEGVATGSSSPLIFTADWFYGMWLRTFFAVDGPASNFATRGPLVIPSFAAIIFISVGLVAAVAKYRSIFRRYNSPVLWLLIATIAVYAVALWFDGYQSFLQTGQAVAINGRYLLPVYPLLTLIAALGLNELLGSRRALKLTVATLALICMLWGGGALTYILRSDDSWYWRSQAVSGANQAVRRVLGPVTPGYSHPTAFMGWN